MSKHIEVSVAEDFLFYTEDRSGKGTGAGLAIVKRIVRAMVCLVSSQSFEIMPHKSYKTLNTPKGDT